MDAKQAYISKPWVKYYPEGVPEEVNVSETSVPELFDQMAKQFGSKTALIFYDWDPRDPRGRCESAG